MLIDSTLIHSLVRGDQVAADALEEAIDAGVPMALSALTVFEVDAGLRGASAQHRERFENVADGIEVAPLTRDVAHHAAAIQRDLYDRGKPIGVIDILIAATALSRDERVITRNIDEFTRVEDLEVNTY